MQPFKKLPTAPTKANAVKIYLTTGRTYREIIAAINKIISENRPDRTNVKFAKNIIQHEWEQLVQTFGIPRGYEW